MPNRRGYIRSSEVGEFVFCRRAWMMKEQKIPASQEVQLQQQRGVEHHAQHGRTADKASTWRRTGILLILLACVLVLIYLLRNAVAR